ncbi:MAG: peptidoglycan DD-metalloendopeptidase family protein [Cyanobacteria bacterium J06648_16]
MTINQAVPSDSGSRVKSAAMLGLAISVGASGVLLADADASAADLQSMDSISGDLPAVPTSSAEAVEATLVPQKSLYHTVEQGESLWKIAQRHRIPLRDIETANSIPSETLLQVGQVIKVPTERVAIPRSVIALAPVQAPEAAVAPVSEGEAADPAVALSEAEASEAAGLPQSAVLQSSAQSAVVTPVTQADGLRSAGLTTQADGFQQELERASELATAPAVPEATNEPNVPLVATLSPSLPQRSYQVRAGDTLESIAKDLGLSTEDLAGANGLNNPDFILAGETLALPEQVGGAAPQANGAEAEAPVVAVVTDPTSAGNPADDQRLAYLQSTAERQVNSDNLLSRLRGEEAAVAESAPVPAEASATALAEEAVADPYAANLLGQIRSARQQLNRADTEVSGVGGAVADVAVAEPDEIAVNPEFDARNAQTSDEVVSAPDETLLAAAPLGPEAYSPVPQPSVGRVVSPDMPMLPDADEYLPDAPDYFEGYIWPARGTLTSGYGRRWGRMHRGVDIAAPVGTPIVAAAPGVVERSGWNSGGYGNLVEIRHPDGSMTRYAHNSRLLVRPGQSVSQGEQIAEMGSTGYSTGPHLHFEIHVAGGGTVNPIAYLPGR